jgi:hypothetical protein
MRIGPLSFDRKTDEELAGEYRDAADTIRRGGLGRLGDAAAAAADRKAARLERSEEDE